MFFDLRLRNIDCGEAGRIELFSPGQVEAACKRSGFIDYVVDRESSVKAPEVAFRIVERAKARSEMIERKRWQAEAAVTTRMSDLPPLPNGDRSDPL